MQSRLDSASRGSACLCLLRTEVKGLGQHAWMFLLFFNCISINEASLKRLKKKTQTTLSNVGENWPVAKCQGWSL